MEKMQTFTVHGGTDQERKARNSRVPVKTGITVAESVTLAEAFETLVGTPYAGSSLKVDQAIDATPASDLWTCRISWKDAAGNRGIFAFTVPEAIAGSAMKTWVGTHVDAGTIISPYGETIASGDLSLA
jgi:hypothetical protein